MSRLLYLLIALCLTAGLPAGASGRPNVLFIAADDLRVEPGAKTPNLNRLAARGRMFTRAYCQQAVCNPSRASLMTGLRPDKTGVHDLTTHFRAGHPDIITLPQLFKQNGYTAVGIGKIYHNLNTNPQGDPASWSRPQVFHWGNHRIDQPEGVGREPVPFAQLPATQSLDVPDEAYLDGRIAAAAVEALGELKDKPFFLAVGFWKPHMPYNAPKKYWDLYQPGSIPAPDPADWPEGAPPVAGHRSPEPRGYAGTPKDGPLPAATIRHLRHGYLASISYLDAQIGKVLDELDRLDLARNTIIVFWSDNGYQIGEHTLVGKLTNFEHDARVPLVISKPAMPRAGTACESIVELVDVYPTLADLCGLTPPHALDGVSLRPVLENPEATVKTAAHTQHPRPADFSKSEIIGRSVRTATHRYTEWRDWNSGAVRARELYDHGKDPKETRNLAGDPASAALVSSLAALLPAPPKPPPPPPGTVIHHSPASSGLYIGSPSICIAPDGSYLASHDLFGPASKEYELGKGRLYRSADKGKSWSHVRDFEGFFWTGLFTHRGAVYLLGTDRHHGRIVIRRSADSGKTWSDPAVIADGQWHTAPVPVIGHAGRVWRAIEDAHTSQKWGERYRALMMSAPAGADLMDPASWTFSNPLARDALWLDGGFAAWLEGNAVAAPDGGIVNVLRVDNRSLPEKAAVVRVSMDGKTATFDPAADFIDLPGGAKKFTIRPDPQGGGYWTLATIIPEDQPLTGLPAATRNTLALLHSPDLRSWEVRRILIRHADRTRHGLQYVDWQFDGNDLIAVCRTAWDDAEGGARNFHDANFMTFHRWPDFRKSTRKDDAPVSETTGAGQPRNPLFDGADPHASLDGGTCWIHATGLGPGPTAFHAASSRDFIHWNRHGPVLDLKDVPWTRADGRTEIRAWAPCTAQRDGRWFFYYSVGPQRPGFPAHIGVASGDSPGGPFKDSGKPLLTGGNGFEAIDPMVFRDPADGRWLLYAGGSAGAKLRVFELADDMISFSREIPVETPPHFTEGAFMHHHAGVYHLTYSHGRWRHDDYSVHHCTAPSATGPWTYRGRILSSDATHKGPGHHSIIQLPGNDGWRIVYHRWNHVTGKGPYPGVRRIAIDPLVHRPDGLIAPVVMSD